MAESDLQHALARHSVQLQPSQVELLGRYCQLLWEWNARLNLTRHMDYETFVLRDVLDTRQLVEHLRPGERILDVGTGGGVPGVLLAILRPDLRVSLSESTRKKADAVAAIVQQLGLPIAVFPRRAEQVLAEQRFDSLVARAVGPLWKMLQWLAPHWARLWPFVADQGAALGRGTGGGASSRAAAAVGTSSARQLRDSGPSGRKRDSVVDSEDGGHPQRVIAGGDLPVHRSAADSEAT